MIQIKNNSTTDDIILVGVRIPPEELKTLEKLEMAIWANNSEVIVKVADGSVSVLVNSVVISDISDAIDVLKCDSPRKTLSLQYPFADKKLLDGKKLFTRVHGLSASVQGSPDTIDFTIPYANCKITGIEIIGGALGDKVDFQILDTATGAISGVSNYLLNQFGYGVYVSKDYYEYHSNYDADLIQGMKIRIIYDAIDELLPKTVYFNIMLHQVV